MKLTDQDRARVAEIEALHAAATPGTWYAVDKGNTVPSHAIMRYATGEKAVNIASGISPKTGNAEFIVNAHGAIPYLLSLIRRLTQEPEVVRCKNCRHSSRIASDISGRMRHCWSLRGRNNGDGFSRVNGDGYCDEGERKEAAHE